MDQNVLKTTVSQVAGLPPSLIRGLGPGLLEMTSLHPKTPLFDTFEHF